MANVYWFGGTGSWTDHTNHWSNNSGNSPASLHGAVPGSDDSVIIDANSGFSGGGTLTIDDANPLCDDFTCSSGHSYTITSVDNTPAWWPYGSFTLEGGITWTFLGAVQFKSINAGETITTAGVDLGSTEAFHFQGVSPNGGVWTLQDDLDADGGTCYLTFLRGTLDANDHNVSIAGAFNSTDPNTRVLNMGLGTWTVGWWNLTNITNLTLNEETSTIKCAGNFKGGGETYNNVWLTASSTVYSSNTFNDFKISAGLSVIFTDGTDQTVSSLTWLGTVGNLITLNGTSTAGWKVSDTTGTNNVDYCDIHYSTAEGGATFNASTDRGNVNGGNNSGWDFSAAAVGPANLKSYNTNLKANIKSIDTNLIANVKSLNTNV